MEYLDRYNNQIVFGLIIAIILSGAVLFWRQGFFVGGQSNQAVTIDIEGAVKKPGIYTLPASSRIVDAINEASGFTKTTDRVALGKEINLASILSDGEKIYIPSKIKTSQKRTTNSSRLVNINTASATQLDSLSGIGPVLAQRIIDFRNSHGGFDVKSDLLDVSGIGPNLFTKIEDLIAVD